MLLRINCCIHESTFDYITMITNLLLTGKTQLVRNCPKNQLDDPILRHHFWLYHGSLVCMDYMLGNIWVCYIIITSPNLKFVLKTRERGSDILCNLNFTMGLTNFRGTVLIFMYLRFHKPFVLIAMVHKFKINFVKIKNAPSLTISLYYVFISCLNELKKLKFVQSLINVL